MRYRKEAFIALDFTSGKLVWALDAPLGDEYYSVVLCSFDSAKAARKFYTARGWKFHALLPDSASFYINQSVCLVRDAENKPSVLVKSETDSLYADALLALGGRVVESQDSAQSVTYHADILTYGRV